MTVRAWHAIAAQAMVSLAGCALLLWSVVADVHWFERHWLGYYCVRDPKTLQEILEGRGGAAVGGILLVFVLGPHSRRWTERRAPRELGGQALRILLALAMALVTCELVLRHKHRAPPSPAAESVPPHAPVPLPGVQPTLPPLRASSAYAWRLLPSHAVTSSVAGEPVVYAVNADGARTRDPGVTFDRARPTILFPGESITFGVGVRYEETYAARVGEELGLQVVNLGVHGYGNEQTYLWMRDVLASFSSPVAVVTIFVPHQLPRNVQERRRLLLARDGSLTLGEPVPPWVRAVELRSLWRELVPYHDDETIALTSAILRETDLEVRRRGALSLFLVTHCGLPCADGDRSWLTRTLFEEPHLPHVSVAFDPRLHVPDDVHPSAAVHRTMADAIVLALRAAAAPSFTGSR